MNSFIKENREKTASRRKGPQARRKSKATCNTAQGQIVTLCKIESGVPACEVFHCTSDTDIYTGSWAARW